MVSLLVTSCSPKCGPLLKKDVSGFHNGCSSPPLSRSRIFALNPHCENTLDFLGRKCMKMWGIPMTADFKIFSFSQLSVPSHQQVVKITTQVSGSTKRIFCVEVLLPHVNKSWMVYFSEFICVSKFRSDGFLCNLCSLMDGSKYGWSPHPSAFSC